MKSHKIINDPVHGFIEVPKGIILDLIDTDVFQRLRRIQQLAFSSLVYPGAVHSRFNHCIGAMHLTRQALDVLRRKGTEISDEEYEATMIAILLHDVGHGPFSHALENVILQGLNHERMSRAIMTFLNERFDGRLSLAIDIFEGNYERNFFHQLVSSQLDMDRLDYLVRDSYFTGVVEGRVSVDRIIKTLAVRNNQIGVEAKGIYSVEKFLVARRLMYWQVYLHRAVLSAEYMIVHILKRARELMYRGVKLWSNKILDYFFRENSFLQVEISEETIRMYTSLDDEDIMYAIKQWRMSGDPILEYLCNNILSRKLLKVELQKEPFEEGFRQRKLKAVMQEKSLEEQDARYLVFTGEVENHAYLQSKNEPINIFHKDGQIEEISKASDIRNIEMLSSSVKKWFVAYPKEITG